MTEEQAQILRPERDRVKRVADALDQIADHLPAYLWQRTVIGVSAISSTISLQLWDSPVEAGSQLAASLGLTDSPSAHVTSESTHYTWAGEFAEHPVEVVVLEPIRQDPEVTE